MRGFEKLQQAKRFDMKKKPIRQRHYLRPVTWLLSYPTVGSSVENQPHQHGRDQTSVLLLCTHHAHRFRGHHRSPLPLSGHHVVAIDGFLKREWLLRNAGGTCKRKFTNDLQLIRQIREVLAVNKDVLALYPEARYTLVGTTAVLPDSLGKMAKLLGVPVVMLNMHGHYLNSPVWNLKNRGSRIEADYSLLFTEEDLAKSSVSHINAAIRKAFEYDEYRWQKENKIRIS